MEPWTAWLTARLYVLSQYFEKCRDIFRPISWRGFDTKQCKRGCIFNLSRAMT